MERLSLDRFDGSTGYYLYDPRGSVTGEITFGVPRYENEYTHTGESYNPNIESQYLRARYYNVVNADFLTGDSYLGNIYEPLTLNRYNYRVSNPVNYRDPSGNEPVETMPEGYIVHHDIENEILQLVDENICTEFIHIGGHSVYK